MGRRLTNIVTFGNFMTLAHVLIIVRLVFKEWLTGMCLEGFPYSGPFNKSLCQKIISDLNLTCI